MPPFVQLYLCVQHEEHGQHIRKAEPAVQAAADGRKIAKLHADNVAHGFAHSTVRVGCQSFVQLQSAQRGLRTDPELGFGLLDGVQSQTGQVDCRADIQRLHLEPDHAADHAVGLFLVERIRFLERLGFLYSRIVNIRYIPLFQGNVLSFQYTTFILPQNML